MKKILLSTIAVVAALILVACGGGGKKPENTISLSYADWGDQEMNQKMIDAFELKYPNIKVELRTDIAGSGEEFTGNLVSAAQLGLLPDVFATDNVPTIARQDLTLDISSYWDADEDTKLVYEHMANTAVYGTKRYAVPSFQFLKGILINLDIFERVNLTTVQGKYRIDDDGYPVKDWTFSEMVEIAKAIKNLSSDANETIVGLDTWFGAADFGQVWPMMDNPDLQYDTWDGEKFNYLDQSWIDAMKVKVPFDALQDGTTTKFTAEQLEAMPHLNGYLIQTGIGAMDIEGTWQFPIIQQARAENINLGFWPYPRSANGDFFPPVVLDYQAVSSQTEHPQEAFLLAKWMTFGRDGWNERIKLLKEERAQEEADGEQVTYLDRYPIANYPEVWDEVRALVEGVEGIEATFDHIENGKPDLDKWMPGYRDFNQWINNSEENTYNYANLLIAGADAVPTYAIEWNKKINELVQQEYNNLANK